MVGATVRRRVHLIAERSNQMERVLAEGSPPLARRTLHVET